MTVPDATPQEVEIESPVDQDASAEPLPEAESEDAATKKNRLPEIPVSARAVITCREDLDRVLKAHQRWIDAVFDPKAEVAAGRANLEGLDLRPYDLSGVNLSGANLNGANLQGVSLVRANLTVASMKGTLLQTANLRGARLTRVKLDGADLRGADLTDAVLTGVDLTRATLRSAYATREVEGALDARAEGERFYEGATRAPLTPEDQQAATAAHAEPEAFSDDEAETLPPS